MQFIIILEDERMCFAIPRGKTTYIGTTDDDYKGNKDDINITKEEVNYLIKWSKYLLFLNSVFKIVISFPLGLAYVL